MARAPIDLRSLARSHTESALLTLVGIAANSESDAARVAACAHILDRGWGKAPQAHTGENGEGDIKVVIRHIVESHPVKTIDNVPSGAVPIGTSP